jgi:hypothetical protein
MGNQPSSPQPPPNSPPPPPVVEICDFECQRQKNLVLLKLALDNTNKESEPEKYEQARIAYYTELNGSAWLEKDKERRAREELKPILTDFNTKYKELTDFKNSNKAFINLSSVLTNQLKNDEEDNSYLNKQYNKEKTLTETLLRKNQLTNTPSPISTNSWLYTIVFWFLVIMVLSLLYSKFYKIKSIFLPETNIIS